MDTGSLGSGIDGNRSFKNLNGARSLKTIENGLNNAYGNNSSV